MLVGVQTKTTVDAKPIDTPDLFLWHLGRLVEAAGEASVNTPEAGGKTRSRQAEGRARKHARSMFVLAGFTIDPQARQTIENMFGR